MKARYFLLLAASLALAGCQDIFNSLFDTASPTGVRASDGEYPNEIQVSWGAPNLSSKKWKDDSVKGYYVTWDGSGAGPGFVTGTSCSIHVDDADRAKMFTVTVQTEMNSGATGGSASDTGFALDTEPLVWYDGGGNYAVAGVDRWYVTMLQEGFTYSFDFGAGSGNVEFYPYKTLDSVHKLEPPASIQAWKCDEGGAGNKFFVRVSPASPGATYRASYGF